ncbi:biotin synthase [Desulfocucumis palustris]|uniref:Biotin synthase n=1 Tax=Desulfocucumis palustris TaxID=1898651 RepID=A0A2L2XBI5_9FIRM|nr:biotin synthase BioB [Desulfocucumis palustris]GBF33344.1 biotin synthase [Desulfocucumis palustris]
MIRHIGQKIMNGENLSRDEAMGLTEIDSGSIPELLSVSNKVARHYRGFRLELCSIMNARSGKCSEDCKFCAQSGRYHTGAKIYPVAAKEEVLKQAVSMERAGAKRFSLVTSGRGISERDLDAVLNALELLKRETGLELCASLGLIDGNKARMLKDAGLSMYHHNLETSPDFYSRICTTHTYQDRVDTINAARKADLRVCAGGIIGLGETFAQRVDMALEIRRLGVDSVPVNFLNPIPGTPLQDIPAPAPLTLLHTLAVFRLILPEAVIRLCGGRKTGLRRLQPLAFWAGADGVMIGDYLTTGGEDLEQDLQLFRDMGFIF